MNIVHLIDYFQPKLGYQETFLSKAHQKIGHRVTIVTSDRYFPFADYDRIYKNVLGKRIVGSGIKDEEGLKVIRLKSIELPRTNLILLLSLKQTLIDLKPDVVFAHGMHSLTSYSIASIKKELKFYLIYDTHAASFNTNFSNAFAKRVYHRLYSMFAMDMIKNQANRIFAIGTDEKQFIGIDFRININNIPVIPLGVDTERFYPDKSKKDKFKNQLKLGKDDYLVIYCGKILPNKDIHVIIRALNNIRNNKVKLLLIGGGDRKYIDFLIGELEKSKIDYKILPMVQNTQLASFYQAADIGVWAGDPSITMLEAMATGLPLIIPYYYGSIYLDESNAILRFKRGDSTDLSKKIDILIRNGKYKNQLGKNAINFVQKRLSWDRIAEATLDLIRT